MSTGFKISTPAIIAVIVCFFLPWLTVSCGGMTISMNGYDLAAGISTGYGERTEGEPIFWLVLIAAIACLLLALLIYSKRGISPFAVFLQVILSGVGLVIIIAKWNEYRSEPGGVLIEPQFGLWGTMLGLAATIAGGAIDLMGSKKELPPGG